MINITAVHLSGGTDHEHIASVKWINPESGKTGENTRQQIVDWIQGQGGKAFVKTSTATVPVHVIEATPPYLRTVADGIPTDNLLALPRY